MNNSAISGKVYPKIDRYTCCFENQILEDQYRDHRWNLNKKYIDGIFVLLGFIMVGDLISIIVNIGPKMPMIVMHPLFMLFFWGFLAFPTSFRKRWHQIGIVAGAMFQNLYQLYLHANIYHTVEIMVQVKPIESTVMPLVMLIFFFVLLPFRFVITMALSALTVVIILPTYLDAIGENYEFLVFGLIIPFCILALNKWRSETMGRQDYYKTVSLDETRLLMHQTLQRYFGEALSDKILTQEGDLQGETRWVTLSFTDLASYSTILERMSPSVAVDFLNEYFTAMHEVIEEHGGQILNYIGDAIMVIYGAPQDLKDHEKKAVLCAINMRERLEILNQKWDKTELSRYWRNHGIEKITARTGIHTGNAITGNLGSERMLQYSAIGDVVNVAARLEQCNKQFGSSIAFSQEIHTALTRDLYEEATFQGDIQLKGRESATKVYSI